MDKEAWTTNDLLKFINECYLLPGKVLAPELKSKQFEKHTGLPIDDYNKYSHRLARLIREELIDGKDYTKIGRNYFFTDRQAKWFLYTNATLNDYFLKEMSTFEGDDRFLKYFDKYTDELNMDELDKNVQYTEELIEERARAEWNDIDVDVDLHLNNDAKIRDAKILLLFMKGAIGSIENIFSFFNVDGDAYVQAYYDMMKLRITAMYPPEFEHADITKAYPYNRSYGYHYFKLMRPLIYYRKDNYYLKHKPYLN